MYAATPAAYSLMHDGALALARMEMNGVKVDVDYLDATLRDVNAKVRAYEEQIREDPLYREWHKLYGERTSLGSREQLGELVFGRLGYPARLYTPKSYNEDGSLKPKDQRRFSTEDEAFEHVDVPMVNAWRASAKLNFIKGTFLDGIKRELIEGYIHPSYHLNTVVTYRSSCSEPNFQNVPVRDPEIADMVRRMYVARGKRRCIVEIDYSQIEVRVAACYHKDPTMLKYIIDTSRDMHRDMAAQIFCIPEDQVSKGARRLVKGAFVFAQFYGDYYVKCARSLWLQAEREKLRTKDDKRTLLECLAAKGITEMGTCTPGVDTQDGTFEAHLKEVERHFWNERFPRYNQWKKDWFAAYQKEGGFDTYTGFRLEGIFSRNDVINYPIQGDAFHCLLWAIPRIQRGIENRELDALLIGEIHDSLLADVAEEHVDQYIRLARKVMVDQLRRAWPWIITPIEVEAEVSPPGGSWFEKKPYHLAA
jgi:DNA polymerase-1